MNFAQRYTKYIVNDDRVKGLKKSIYRPGQALWGSRRFRIPEFLDKEHMKMAMFSAQRTGRL
jgi:hypothetical protein